MRLLPLLIGLALLAGCGGDGAAARDRVTVVATTTQAADLVRNVAGPGAEVVSLLPAGADPHGYEVRPEDLQALADADVVVRSGGDLDEWLGDAIEGAGSDARVLTLIDVVDAHEGGHAHEAEDGHAEAHADEDEDAVDPHWWHDPRNAILAAEAIGDALGADPAPYVRELRALDREIAACIDGIPPERRKLVTTHDALGYYAERYGLEVVGAVIPSRSTEAQPSAGDTAELVDTIRAEGVPAIFAESSIDPSVEQAIAREAGARVGDPLYADTLGPDVGYVESMRANTEAIAAGLGAPCA